jgi:hypothetical protein
MNHWLGHVAQIARGAAAPLVLLSATAVGYALGLAWALWILASAALLLAILLFWESLLALGTSADLTLEEALSLAAPTAADEQKRALLSALKDLDQELLLGKLSLEDHKLLSRRYRRQAVQLLQRLDRNLGPMRERAEQLLEQRLAAASSEQPQRGKSTGSDSSQQDPGAAK